MDYDSQHLHWLCFWEGISQKRDYNTCFNKHMGMSIEDVLYLQMYIDTCKYRFFLVFGFPCETGHRSVLQCRPPAKNKKETGTSFTNVNVRMCSRWVVLALGGNMQMACQED